MTYHDLLDQFNLLTLKILRREASLTILFKIIHKICFQVAVHDHIFKDMSTPRHHNLHNLTLPPPFTRTNSFTYSFVPHTITLWNNPDYATVNASSIQSFIYLVNRHLIHLVIISLLLFVFVSIIIIEKNPVLQKANESAQTTHATACTKFDAHCK